MKKFTKVLSLVLVLVGYACFVAKNFVLFNTIEFCSMGQVFGPLLCWFVGIGVLLGAFGSAISIRRYLRV